MKDSVRIVVVGDEKVGKTSIIEVLITANFEEEVQPVLPVLVVPKEVTPERVHVSIVDTPGDPAQEDKVDEELKRADVIVLVYSVNNESTQKRVSEHWLAKFRKAKLKVPIILVGNKIDTRGGISDPDAAAKMEAFIKPIMDNYREVDVCIECSAKTVSNISEVFYFAQKAVLHPTGPLYDVDNHCLKPPAAAALRRIFKICDKDGDGGLNDKELNDFQYTCFNVHLQQDELAGVKKVVQENRPDDGVRSDGSISVEGFIFLHTLFVQKGRLETTWIVLRKFGYDDNMHLSLDEKSKIRHADDQSVELTAKGKKFLLDVFAAADKDADGMLSPEELRGAFSDYPGSAFAFSNIDAGTGERLVVEGKDRKPNYYTLDAFLTRWALYALDSPNDALLAMMYLGYVDTLSSALKITKSRKRDRYNKTVSREVFNVLVLGDKGPIISDIVRGLVGHAASGIDSPGIAAVAALNGNESSRSDAPRTLVMRDSRGINSGNLLSSKSKIASADVLCIAFDASSRESVEYAKNLWEELKATRASSTVPVVFVASVENSDDAVLAEADAMCVSSSLPTPVRVDLRGGEDGNLYQDLLGVALYPQVACPEYYEASGSSTSSTTRILQVTAGTLVISGLLYGAKRLYDYYTSRPSSSN